MFGRAAWIAALVVASALWARSLGWGPELLRTHIVLSLVGAHLMLAFVVRSESFTFRQGWTRNRALLAAILGSLLLQVGITYSPLRGAFGFVPPPPVSLAVAALVAMLGVAGLDVARWILRRTRA